MNWAIVDLVIDLSVRNLCFKPYPNHRRGCPNYKKKPGCPPQAPMISDVLDITQPVWAVWNVFDFASHCKKMKAAHPGWSKRQIECCLYWQPRARKQLKGIIEEFSGTHKGLRFISCPEACGVNVTKTMCSVGQILEWPPFTKTYQIIIAGLMIRDEKGKKL